MIKVFRKILYIFCFGEEALDRYNPEDAAGISSEKKTKKEKILNFFLRKDSADGHTPFYKLLIFLLIFTSGMGAVGSILIIRPVYLVAFAVAVTLVLDKIRTLDFTSNKRYLMFFAFLFVWGAYSLVQGAIVEEFSYYSIYLKGLFVNIFLIFVILDYVRNINDVRFLMYCFAAYIAVCLTIGLFEIFADLHIVSVRETSHWLPHSFYRNENDNAAVLAYGVYVIFLCLLNAKARWLRVTFSILLALTAFETVMTKSRAAMLGIVVMAICTAVFSLLILIRERSKKLYRIVFVSGVLLLVALTVLTFVIFTPDELVDIFSGDGNKQSDSLRFDLVISGIRSVFETYGLGLGAGQSITLNRINLHNFYLELFTEYGVIIGGVFFAFLLGIMLEFKNFKWSEKKACNVIADGLVRSLAIVLAIVGIGPSSAMNLRATWIVVSIIFAFKYVNCDRSLSGESSNVK